jgi:23S rRNA (adenine2030-N6)-methyltransferase
MFSYRHGFHAGNHADVLKHITLIASLRLLHKKETPLMLIDTHAGTGIYDLEDHFAKTSLEANEGILKLFQKLNHLSFIPLDLKNYLEGIKNLQTHPSSISLYPGSPYLLWQSMREKDKLRLMELHPTDFPILADNLKTMRQKGQDIQAQMSNGFDLLKAYLPPPSRRGLILMDPSYEDKGDYFAALESLKEALKRFSTGVYLVWYPVLSRLDAAEFVVRQKKLCEDLKLEWLQAELRIKSNLEPGLSASGMFVINPPWQLKDSLEETLPILKNALEIDGAGTYSLATNAS